MREHQLFSLSRRHHIHVESEDPFFGIEPQPDYFGPEIFDQVVRTPEQKLIRAVLEDAFTTFNLNFGLNSQRSRRLLKEVEDWIQSDDQSYLFSFVSICDHLGLEPEFIRRKLKELKLKGPSINSFRRYQKAQAHEVA